MAGEVGQLAHQEMDIIENGPGSTQSIEQQMQAKLAAAKLNCQICSKFSTFSFRTFQSHIRRHQQANEIGPESVHRKLVRSGRVRRKYSVSSRVKKFRLHSTNMSLNAQLDNGQSTSTRSMALVCPHCKFTADKFSNLSIHVKRKHTNLVQTQVFLCKKCNFSAPSRRALQSHLLQMNHYERQCQICNEVFEGNSQYLDHLGLHFSGISVSPVKEQTTEPGSSFSSAVHVSSLHDALKEAAILETEVASNSHFSTRGKSRSLPLAQDVQRPVFSSSVIAKLCNSSGPASNRSYSSESKSDDREVTMETQACSSAAVEMDVCVDSVACSVETQTEDVKSAEKSESRADDNDGGMNIDVTNEIPSASTDVPSTSETHPKELIASSSSNKTTSSSVLIGTGSTSDQDKGDDNKPTDLTSGVERVTPSKTKPDEEEKIVQEYTCVHCDITFRDKVLFTVHRGSHGFKNPFSCNLCGADLKDKYEFAAHFHCS